MKIRLKAAPKLFGSDEHGHVYRTVRAVWGRGDERIAIVTRECGHVLLTGDTQTIGDRIRCRMCERIFRELNERRDTVNAKLEKQKAQERAWIRSQLQKQPQKRLVLRRPQPTLRIRLRANDANPKARRNDED